MNSKETDPILRYAKDIRIEDIERLESFINARTERLRHAERGSDERQLARAVRAAMTHLTITIQNDVTYLMSDNGSQVVHKELVVSWNALWALVSPWQYHDDYDLARWRPVKHWDATEAAAWVARALEAPSKDRSSDT
ncbi:hypothetical protein [Streptomyces ehimensis]|uniref:Uncharacterized protein n=1 Tax=Streptomyces ehimensis TaxID=68195 RepID=A0ABV9BUD4_9ACTN